MPAKGFGITGMGRCLDAGDDAVCQQFLAAEPWRDGFGRRRGPRRILTRFQGELPRYSSRRVRGWRDGLCLANAGRGR